MLQVLVGLARFISSVGFVHFASFEGFTRFACVSGFVRFVRFVTLACFTDVEVLPVLKV